MEGVIKRFIKIDNLHNLHESCGSFEMIIKNALGNTYLNFRNKAAALFTLVKTVLIRISEENFESERFLENSIDVHVKFILYCLFICFP